MPAYTTQTLYVAFFNRPADAEGLAFWEHKRSGGESLESIARQFSPAPEYKALYEGKTSSQIIDAIYHNLFGRVAEQGGLDFWGALLDDGRLNVGNIVSAILDGAHSADIAAVANRTAAGQAFTEALVTAQEQSGYSGSDAAAAARTWLSTVNGDASSLTAAMSTMTAAVSAAVHAGLGDAPQTPQTYVLTAGTDVFTGTAGNDTFEGGSLDTFSSSDSLDGGDGTDTFSALVSGPAAPAGVTVHNIETLNLTTSGTGYTIDTSSYTGLQTLNLTASAQGAGAIQIDGSSAVNLAVTGATGGTITIGATTAATAVVTVSETVALAAGATAGAISVRGGTTVSIAETATTTGALGTIATQSAISVTGTAATTAVTVNQTATVAAVDTVAASTETALISWAGFNAGGPGYQLAGGIRITTTDHATHTAAQVATVAAGGTVAGLVLTPAPVPLWSVGPAIGGTTLFTSLTANANVKDVAVTGSGYTYSPVASTTQGVNAVAGAAGLAAGTVTISDVNAASLTEAGTITSVSLNNFGVATANASALSSITLGGTGTSFALTSGGLSSPTTTTVALNLNGLTTTGAVSLGAVPTVVSIASATAASTLNSLSAIGATAIHITGDQALTVTAHALAANADITSTGTGAVTFGDVLLAGQSYTGGSGADTIKLSASSTRAISTGGGNDTVTYAGPMGTGGMLDGGQGTDTLLMTGSQATTALGSTAFSGKVTNFEALTLTGTWSSMFGLSLNMANASGINKLTTDMTSGSIDINHAAADFTLVQTGIHTSSNYNTISLANANGSADHIGLAFTAADGYTRQAYYSISNVENLAITTADTDTLTQTAAIGAQVMANAATTVTLAGDMGVDLSGGLTHAALTSLDASGLTASGAFGGLTFTTGGLSGSSNIKGGAAGTNTVNFSAANTASTFVTYTGGTGADIVTGSNGNNNSVNLGDGANTFTGAGGGNNTITGGTGVDSITVGTGANTISTGGGNDVIHIGGATGSNTVNVGTGVDSIFLDAIQTASGNLALVTGMGTGDILNLASVTDGHAVSAQTSMGAAITVGGMPVLADYLNAAAAGDGAAANTAIKWFQFNGNTYVVEDTSAAATFQDGHDSVIELIGLVDLSASTVASGVITL
jgi:S-layer protein